MESATHPTEALHSGREGGAGTPDAAATLCLQFRSREVTAEAQLAFFLSLNEVWAPVHKTVPLTLREGPSSPVVFPWQYPHSYVSHVNLNPGKLTVEMNQHTYFFLTRA